MNSNEKPFHVVVLAADRTANDPVAEAAGVACKALVPVAGRSMVLRVLDALAAARQVGERVLIGPAWVKLEQNAELAGLVDSGQIRWLSPERTPSASAFRALRECPDDVPVLLTTADHALLSAEMVDHFCTMARSSGCDVVAGVARYELIAEAFPGTRRTVTRLKDGGYCGCNLFAFMTPRSRSAADFWRQVEQERKKPLRVVKVMGWLAVVRYLLGQLTLQGALDQLSRRMQMRAGTVLMPFAEAAVDVDKLEDWRLVESVLAAQAKQAE